MRQQPNIVELLDELRVQGSDTNDVEVRAAGKVSPVAEVDVQALSQGTANRATTAKRCRALPDTAT